MNRAKVSPCSTSVPKDYTGGYSIIWPWAPSCSRKWGGETQHGLNYECLMERSRICHPNTKWPLCKGQFLVLLTPFLCISSLRNLGSSPSAWATSSHGSWKVSSHTAQSSGLRQVARCQDFHCHTGQELCHWGTAAKGCGITHSDLITSFLH